MNLSLAPILLTLLLGAAAPAQAGSIQVMLFGQPCQLQGPASVSDSQLKAIHQISPEQTPLSDSLPVLQNSIEKLKLSPDLPQGLARYFEQRSKAARVRVVFEEGVQAARKTRSGEQFAKTIQPLISPKKLKPLVKAFERALKAGNAPSEWEQLRFDFAEASEPDGEEEFHRALRKLKVSYHCSFESFDHEAESEPSSADGKGLNQPTADH
ncbi:MAG: hypothetical protein ACK5QT_01320 [Oligoflexia bacterium]